MIISSGDICQDYEVLGLVVGFASRSEGCSGIDIEFIYQLALERLVEAAKEKGAYGLLFVNFQNRVSRAYGCFGPKNVLEVFAWGTAVKWA